MPEYEDTVTVSRDPDQLFSFLSDIDQMPKHIPGIRSVERQEEDRVRIEGSVMGRSFAQAGYFRADPETRRIEFGSEQTSWLAGWIQVTQGPDLSASDLTLHLDLDLPEQQEEKLRSPYSATDQQIRDSVSRAVRYLKSICERQDGPLGEANRTAAS